MKLVDITEGRNFSQRKEFGQVVNALKKAETTLSVEAKAALLGWESNSWHNGTIQRAHNGLQPNEDLLGEFAVAFAPVRQLLQKYWGPTIGLLRGEKHYKIEDHDSERTLYSWTLDEDTAKGFSSNKRQYKILPEEEIQKMIVQYNKTGYVKVFGYQLQRNKEMPEYYNIWRRGELLTDGDDVEKFIRSENQDRVEFNDTAAAKGRIFTQQIPIDKIVWINHRLGSAEFIVAQEPNRS